MFRMRQQEPQRCSLPPCRRALALSWDFEKTGWCECCGYQFPKTQLHHFGGRADNSKAKEMCRPCHFSAGTVVIGVTSQSTRAIAGWQRRALKDNPGQ
jgi:hypothetical protein